MACQEVCQAACQAVSQEPEVQDRLLGVEPGGRGALMQEPLHAVEHIQHGQALDRFTGKRINDVWSAVQQIAQRPLLGT